MEEHVMPQQTTKPRAKQPTAKRSAPKKPAAKKPTAKKPTAKRTSANKPKPDVVPAIVAAAPPKPSLAADLRTVTGRAWIGVFAIASIVVTLAVLGITMGRSSEDPGTAPRNTIARPLQSSAPSEPTAAPVAPVAPAAESAAPSFDDWEEYRDPYFFAAMPPGWDVVGATANGIDISPPDKTATASFAYVKGSVAGANAYNVPTDNAGYAAWILQMQGAQDVRMGTADPLGTQTDALGLTWTFDAREFDAVTQGSPVHGVLQVGTTHDAYGTWVGMGWQRVARADRWDALKDDLAAVARSISLLQVASTEGGGIRMPATDTSTGEISATQSDVEDRLSQARQDATMGGQSLTDETTGDRYWAPFTAYDESRGGYFIEKSSGSQELAPDY